MGFTKLFGNRHSTINPKIAAVKDHLKSDSSIESI